jgi:hypothetical protein
MTEYKTPVLTSSYVQLFVNAQGKLDVDRLVEESRLLALRLNEELIHLVAPEVLPKKLMD